MATNAFLRPGVMDRKTYTDLVSRNFDTMWAKSNEEVSMLDQFFYTVDADGGEDYRIGNLTTRLSMPIRNEDTDDMPYSQPAPGFSKTITFYPYRMAIRVTDTMRRMDRYAKIPQAVSGLPNSAKAKLEYLRVDQFNSYAFSGTTGADSLSLCYDSHPHENVEMGTWDNLSTGPASVGNLHTARQLGLKMTNEWGRPQMVQIKRWLIPIALDKTFQEIQVAPMDPETALNTPNVYLKGNQFVVSPHLSSETAYFGFGDMTGDEHGIYEVFLMRPGVADNSPANADIITDKRIKFIVGHGFSTSKNVVGSAGT